MPSRRQVEGLPAYLPTRIPPGEIHWDQVLRRDRSQTEMQVRAPLPRVPVAPVHLGDEPSSVGEVNHGLDADGGTAGRVDSRMPLSLDRISII